jgi:uncharacterized delta-60 repeat protein
MLSTTFKKIVFLCFVCSWGYLFAEDVKASLSMPDLSPGTNGSFTLSPLTSGTNGTCSGTVTENFSGVTSIVPDNCSGRYEGKAGVTRHGFRFSSFHLFRSVLNQNQMVVVNSAPSCPSNAVTYNYLMVRTRSYNDYVAPFDASSITAWMGGVIQYDPLATTIASGVSRFSLESMAQDTTAYGMDGFKGEGCSSGEWKTDSRSYSSSNRPLDNFNTWMFGNNLAVVRSVGGNPIVAVAVPQASLSVATMASKSTNVFSGLFSGFNGRGQQTQKVIYLVPSSSGTTFDLHEANSLTNTSSKTAIGTLDCSEVNNPAPGFCSGTLTMNAVSGTGKAACLFSYGNQGKDLMFCTAQAPNVDPSLHKKSTITIISGTSSRSLLAITAPTGLHLSAGSTSGTLNVTVTNLTSRAIPSLSLTNTLTAPFVEPTNLIGNTASAVFQSFGDCGTSLPAFSSCTIPITYSPSTQQANGALFRLSYDNGVSTPNATANLIGSRGLVSISVSSNPSYTVGGQGTVATVATYANGSVQDISSLATISNSNTSVIQLAANGQLTAASAGTSNLQSSFSSFTSSVRTITSYQADIVLKLDASQYNGTAFPSTGCNTTTWTNLATTNVTSTLTNFSSCSSYGWQGNGTATNPYVLSFDGISQYVDMGTPSSFPVGTSDKTICAWAQTKNVSGSYAGTILSYGKASTRQSISIGTSGNSTMTSSFGDGIVTTRVNGNVGNWPSGTWKHLCVSQSNGVVRLYTNGSLSLTKALPNNWSVVANVAYLGRNVDGTGYWKGNIAQASIYNRVLSQGEIVGLCKSGIGRFDGVTCAPLSVQSYSVSVGASVTVEPIGGVAPFVFNILSGGGSIDSSTGLFIADSNGGSTQVGIVDGIGQSAVSNIAVGARTNPTYVNTVLADQPLGYWRLGETTGSTASDSSGNGRHGTYISVTRGQNGAIYGDSNSSAYFDGVNSYITTPVNVSELQNGYSLESWVRTSTLSTGAGSFFSSSLSNNFRCGKTNQSGDLQLSSGTYTSTQNLTSWYYATFNVGDDSWHHVVCVWDKVNGKQLIYFDGNILASQSVTTNNLNTDYGVLTIGAQSGKWYGNLDEVAVYGSALSISQIRNHFQNRWVIGPSALSQILISPTNPSVIESDPQSFFAQGIYSDNSRRDITALVDWTSSQPTVANFSADSNIASALVAGSTNVIASLNGITASTILNVKEPIFVRAKGFDDYVLASLVTPDGLYVGGAFTIYSSTPASKIIRFLPSENRIDTTFSIPGTGINNTVYAIARDPNNGKIYIGGNFTTINGVSYNRIVRLGTNGTPDTSFSIGTGFNNTVLTLAVAGDGKVYVGGDFTSYNGTSINRIVRLNTNGSLDTSYAVGTGADNSVKGIALDSAGKSVVVGQFTNFDGVVVNKITRRLSTGAIDNSFVSTGVTGGNTTALIAVLIDSEDRIYGGMNSYGASYNGVSAKAVFRANSDGSIDSTYTTNINAPFAGYQYVSTLALDSGGKLYVGGYFWGAALGALARFNTNGTQDTSFDIGLGINVPGPWTLATDNGKVYAGGLFVAVNGVGISGFARINADGTADKTFMDVGAGFLRPVGQLFQDRTGKFLVSFGGGWHANGYNGVAGLAGLARLNRDGTFDESVLDKLASFTSSNNFQYLSFADDSQNRMYQMGSYNPSSGVTTGVVTNRWYKDGTIDYSWTPILPTSGQMRNNAFKVDKNDRVYLGGSFTSVNGQTWNRIIRYSIDGSIDSGFQIGTGFDNTVWAIRPDETNQKIYVGGEFTSFNGVSVNRLVRLNLDGTLDTTFDVGTGFNSTVVDIALTSEGKIVVAGDFTTFRGSSQNRIVRLNTDGTKDTSFNIGTGFNGQPTRIEINNAGKVYAGGAFTSFNGTSRNYVLRLASDGTLDTAFDTASGGLNGRVYGMAVDPSGDLIIGGAFSIYKGVYVDRLLRLTPTGDRR